MTYKLLEEYIRQLIESNHPMEVTVAWQGGEPTMLGIDYFKRAVEYVKKYSRHRIKVINTIQTNGTLINDEWAMFFKENNFLVGISIDGPQEIHDTYRVDKAGMSTFHKTMRGLSCLQEYEVEYNVLTTINNANVSCPLRVYRFLRDECGAKYIQFIPIVERSNDSSTSSRNKVTDQSITAELYGIFLIEVFEDWIRSDVASVYVQIFDTTLASWYGEKHGMCVFSPICGTSLAMEHNGDVYSCDHFVEPAFKLGNIWETHMGKLVYSNQQLQFGRSKLDSLPKYCLNCEVRFACHGGCLKDRFLYSPDGEYGLNYLCTGYKLFYNHVDKPMRIMAKLLHENRPPAEIMKMYAAMD